MVEFGLGLEVCLALCECDDAGVGVCFGFCDCVGADFDGVAA